MKRKWLTVGIILLFIGITYIPAIAQNIEKPLPASRGNWLYVGGSGPGNYSTIQEAIDASINGDTIVVFDDSSPYFENVIIDKSITVIGEDKETTVIDGSMNGDVVKVMADNVEFSGFTVRNSQLHDYYAGIHISSSEISIHDCNIMNTAFGVYMSAGTHNSISYNQIEHNYVGIQAVQRCSIIGNTLMNNEEGIRAEGRFIEINQNMFLDNNVGLFIYTPGLFLRIRLGLNKVINNLFKENKYVGIEVYFSNGNLIKENDFIDNYVHADFLFCHWQHWNKNYWFPRTIMNSTCPYVIKSLFFLEQFETTWLNFDWHPAQEPYDIPEMS